MNALAGQALLSRADLGLSWRLCCAGIVGDRTISLPSTTTGPQYRATNAEARRLARESRMNDVSHLASAISAITFAAVMLVTGNCISKINRQSLLRVRPRVAVNLVIGTSDRAPTRGRIGDDYQAKRAPVGCPKAVPARWGPPGRTSGRRGVVRA
jgi:hypothetical protein